MTPARYLQCSAAWTLIALAAVVSVNVSVDPAGLFGGTAFERRLAKTLIAGGSYEITRNFDERRFQKYYIEDLSAVPQVVVLGSSRALGIGESLFPGKTFFNSGVSGAALQDLLAIFHLYGLKGVPSTVILGVDPWTLNRNSGHVRWQTLRNEYELEAKDLAKSGGSRHWGLDPKWTELISLAYFLESLRHLASGGVIEAENVSCKMKDGTFVPAGKNGPSVDRVRAKAVEYAAKSPIYGLADFYKLDADYSELLESFLRRLRERGVETIVVLAPYHPEVYRVLLSDTAYRNVAQAEAFYRRAANSVGAKVVGSYDPSVAGCVEADFYDGMHPNESCIEKIFQRMRNSK